MTAGPGAWTVAGTPAQVEHTVRPDAAGAWNDFGNLALDEARELFRTHFYPVHLDPLGRPTAARVSYQVVRIGPVTLGRVRYSDDVRVRAGDLQTGYQVSLMLSGRMPSHHRGHTVVADSGRAVVFQPAGPVLMSPLRGGDQMLTVKVERDALEQWLGAALDHPVTRPVDLAASLDVSAGAGRSWARLVRLLADDAALPGSVIGQPTLAERLADGMISGLMLAIDHPHRDQLVRPEPHLRPRPVKRAVDAMRADPAHAFTVAELAGAAGVSVRTLQAAFHRHTGMTPTAYLRELRLAHAHEDLCRADPGRDTVADVARRWGFAHLGRFAAAYRRRYGVAPSVTLRG